MPISPAPAVLRACDVLQHLARHPTDSFSVSELARDLDMPRATCDAVLQGLAEGGFVVRRDDLRYELGPACIVLGDAARVANSVLRATCVEAEQLARTLAACTAVSMRHGDGSSVAEVFDFGPTFGLRAQVGQSIPHSPPFGAMYVAWQPHDADEWIARAGPSLDERERTRYVRALADVRRRGFSVTLSSQRQTQLESVLSTLADQPNETQAQRTRDELIAKLAHSEYLATDLDADSTMRVSLMAAPVFDRTGRAVTSILLLGPDYEITTAELSARGEALVRAAARATQLAGGQPPTADYDSQQYVKSPRHEGS
jgi:DNA-binding IclR family transcriptional regulator